MENFQINDQVATKKSTKTTKLSFTPSICPTYT